jgi:hypothetical protein
LRVKITVKLLGLGYIIMRRWSDVWCGVKERCPVTEIGGSFYRKKGKRMSTFWASIALIARWFNLVLNGEGLLIGRRLSIVSVQSPAGRSASQSSPLGQLFSGEQSGGLSLKTDWLVNQI